MVILVSGGSVNMLSSNTTDSRRPSRRSISTGGHTRLQQVVDGARAALQGHVNAGRNGRHQLTLGSGLRQAHHQRHRHRALLLFFLAVNEREQAEREGHGQRLQAQVFGQRVAHEHQQAGEEVAQHQLSPCESRLPEAVEA